MNFLVWNIMSAITGMFLTDGKDVNYNLFKGMNNSLNHRGPDGSRIWVEGPVALGHQMLHTTPESIHEKLPFKDENSGMVITADARIDNREELSPLLKLENSKKVPDSHFILKSYQKWGDKCPEKLLGDFAFAIWDPGKEQLFCARDHMGVKPFYYYLSDESFLFASEIKSLLMNKEVEDSINEVMIADFLIPMFDDRQITFYEKILRLAAAHHITINYNSQEIIKYWDLDPKNEIHLPSDQEYMEKFREIFTDAVKCRIRSAFPVGSFLSGGLDSSSIVCTARRLSLKTDHELKTFSAIFDQVTECDERFYINAVLRDGNLEPHYVHPDEYSPFLDEDKVLWHNDQPFFAPNLFIHWLIYSKAKECNVRVILDGIDGDTTISHGELCLTELLKKKHISELIREINLLSNKYSRYKILKNAFLPLIPLKIREILQLILKANKNPLEIDSILNEDFKNRIKIKDRYDLSLKSKIRNASNNREFHYYILNRGILQLSLELADHTAAAFSMESRNPFYDKRLIEFCLALPSIQKLNKGWDRVILRRAMENILPKEVQWRRNKSNLGPNFRRNLIKYEKNAIENLLYKNPALINKYVDLNKLKEIYDLYKSGKNLKHATKVWRPLNLALWQQKHKFINKY